MRSPQFGVWRERDGDTAQRKQPRRTYTTALRGSDPCPDCRRRVFWDVAFGEAVRLDMDGRVHLCDPDTVLRKIGDLDGEEVLRRIRRTLNERRMYGEAV